jgi:hypothetical protein
VSAATACIVHAPEAGPNCVEMLWPGESSQLLKDPKQLGSADLGCAREGTGVRAKSEAPSDAGIAPNGTVINIMPNKTRRFTEAP